MFSSPSLSPLWQVKSFIDTMQKITTIKQIEDRLFMDWSLEMVIHGQKIVQVLQSNSLTNNATNSKNEDGILLQLNEGVH